ncbi:MAG: hypothetical protein R3345_12470, partial [Fulvivirga sp.]|nr:hypothetical protein [Fulvivirga sp.]
MSKSMLFIFICCCLVVEIHGQELKEKGDSFFANNLYEEALTSYTKHIKKNPKDSSAWYKIAMANLHIQE